MKPIINKLWMFIAMLCTSSFASAYDFEANGVFYTVISVPDLTVEVSSSPTKYDGFISIPKTVEWSGHCFNVVGIGYKAFADCSELKEIHIPPIKSIDSDAFKHTVLEKVHLDDIESWLQVDISHSGYTNGSIWCSSPFNNGAFLYLNGEIIETLTIPEGIKSLNDNFAGCGSIRKASLPESCTYLNGSFAQCNNLETIDVKGLNICIGSDTFNGCNKITDFNFLKKCKYLEDGAFRKCGMSQITIPNTVTSIGYHVFRDCKNLEYCSIGNGISELPCDIDPYADDSGMDMFNGCNNLKSLEIVDSETPLKVGRCGNRLYLDIEKIHYYGSFARLNLESISINRNLTYSGSNPNRGMVYAPLAGNGTLKTAYVGGSTTTVGEDFFRCCSSLEHVSFGNNIIEIHETAFRDCKNLKQIKLEAEIPPKFTSNYISHNQQLTVTIIVPNGNVDLYRQSAGWKNFLNIIDETSASIETISANDSDDCLIVNEEGILYIGESLENVYVYDINGSLIHSTGVNPNQSIALPNGMYVVRIKNKSFKVKI